MTALQQYVAKGVGSLSRFRRRLSTAVICCGAIFAVSLTPASAAAPAEAWTAPVIAVVGGRIIDGYGQAPIENGTVLIEGEKIVAVGSNAEVAVPAGAKVIDASGRTVLPGMIELHAHLLAVGHGDYRRYFQWLEQHKDKYSYERMMEISARQLLLSGITTAVDLGGPLKPSLAVRDKIARGEITGPRLMVAGPWLVPQGALFPETSLMVGNSTEAAIKAVQGNVDAGVDIIKIQGRLNAAQYKAAADTAHKGGILITAHVNGPDEIMDAVNGGIDILQHVGAGQRPTYSDDLVKAVINHNVAVVPTAAGAGSMMETVKFPERLQDPVLKALTPPDIWAEMQDSFKDYRRLGYFRNAQKAEMLRADSLKQWLTSGATVGIGTDNGVPLTFHTDALWQIGKIYADLGMTPMWVITAMTRVNASIIGKGNEIGTLEPGKYADLVIVRGDPLDDLENLANVETVIKNGAVYKGGLTLSFEGEEGQTK
jgi:imidazolonepropionase-like amidohydrolase